MASVATFAYLPILSFLLGAAAGFTAGRWLGLHGLLWLIGLASAVGLALIVFARRERGRTAPPRRAAM